MKEKDKMETAINDIFSSLLTSEEAEIKNSYGKIIKNLLDSGFNIKKMDVFNIMVSWKIEQILNNVVSSLNSNVKDTKGLDSIKFLYLNYAYMKCNIERLIVQREGMCCCVDKSRHILEAYKDYLTTGELPEINDKRQYFVFNFGTYKQWFNLCKGLLNLYYGNPKDYMIAYKELLEADLRNQETKAGKDE